MRGEARPQDANGRRVAELVGVTTEPGLGVVEGVGPYQFRTVDGVPVNLHECDFLGLLWLPDATARFYFVHDLEWTPVEALATPVVELSFSEFQVVFCELDAEAPPDSPWVGQVSSFSWDGGDAFDLTTFTLHLAFTAARMEVRLLATAASALTGGPEPGMER